MKDIEKEKIKKIIDNFSAKHTPFTSPHKALTDALNSLRKILTIVKKETK